MATSFVASPDVRATVNDDGGVILNVKTGLCYSLNPVGAYIWTSILRGIASDQVIAQLAHDSNAPQPTVQRDVLAFLTSLQQLNLIITSRPAEKRNGN